MRHVVAFLIFALAACRNEEPPAPTTEQTDQLNEAESMLNAMAQNEEGPADRSTGPSNSSE